MQILAKYNEDVPILPVVLTFDSPHPLLDVNTVDETLMSDFVQLMGQISVLLTAIFTVVTASPSVSVVLPFLLIFYKQQYDYFSQSNRELQRIVSAIKSPTYALFGEALNGFW